METYFKLVGLVDNLIKKVPLVNDVFCKIERQIGVSRIILLHATTAVLLVSFAIGYMGSVTKVIFFYIYPAYESVQALDTKEYDKIIHWLTYWAVFALFAPLEECTLLELIPFYNVIKIVFVIWLYVPIEPNGSGLFLNRYIIPLSRLISRKSLDKIGADAIDKISETLKARRAKVSGMVRGRKVNLKNEHLDELKNFVSIRSPMSQINSQVKANPGSTDKSSKDSKSSKDKSSTSAKRKTAKVK